MNRFTPQRLADLIWKAVTSAACIVALVPTGSIAARAADSTVPTVSPDHEQFFEEKVRPLLVNKCVDCHGPDKQESGLRLDSRLSVLKGGDSGEPAVMSGHPEHSRLLKAVRREGDYKMPPSERERLLPAEIDTLSTWIKLGLPWGKETARVEISMEERYQQARRSHWAFQPIQSPAIPAVNSHEWSVNTVDHFVMARLEAANITPSLPAGRRTLVRRITLDLIGLPPTPDEVEAFVANGAPDAFERLTDRLLASPHYGERWGRHWLDVARYADTRGYAFQKEPNYPYAYTYRDYVVRSLNADLPYDQFVVEQLAADQLPSGPDNRNLAALGYLTVGRKYQSRNDDFDDQIDVVTRGMLGLTVACARCHDHKYDAIPTEDYYSLFGIFSNCRQPDDLPYLGNPADAPGYAVFQAELEQLRKAMQDFVTQKREAVISAARQHVTDYFVRMVSTLEEADLAKLPFIKLKDDDLKPKIVDQWRSFISEKTGPDHPVFGPWQELVKLPEEQFSQAAPAVLAKWDNLSVGLDIGQVHPWIKTALSATPPQSRIDVARLYGKLLEDAYAQWQQAASGNATPSSKDSLEQLPAEVAVLVRLLVGDESPTNISIDEPRDFLSRADRTKQAELKKKVDEHEVRSPNAPPRAMVVVDNSRLSTPRVLLRGNQNRPGKEVPRQFVRLVAGDARQPFTHGSGRLELAKSIVAADNPLTARVIANRVWMHHFDAPLVSTPSDFGIRSDPPTHPALLDYLASRLRDSGWSLKDLHRQIVHSNTYRQASTDRPQCKAADPENRLLWRMNRRRLEFEPLRDSILAVAGQLDTAISGRSGDVTRPVFRRRTIYGKVDRQDLPNLLRVFDFASPDQSSPGRSRTTVPQQALFLLNSPFAVEQAQALATRAEVADAGVGRARVISLYGLLFGRPPREEEVEVGLRFVAAVTEDNSGTTKVAPWEQYAHLLLLSNEFAYVD